MRRPQGYARLFGPGLDGVTDQGIAALQRDKECDTFTCAHCNRVVHVPALTDPANIGGLCKQCMGFICPACVEKAACTPFESKLEAQLTRAARLKDYR